MITLPTTTLSQQVKQLFTFNASKKPVEAKKAVPATPVASATASVAPTPVKAAVEPSQAIVEAPQPVVETSKATAAPTTPVITVPATTVTPATGTAELKSISSGELSQLKTLAVEHGIFSRLKADQVFGK